MLVLLAGYAVLLWICACVADGSNWARIAVTFLLLIVALTIVAVVATLGLESPPWKVTTLLDISSYAIDAYVLFLIWTKPGSAWFRRVDRAAAATAAEWRIGRRVTCQSTAGFAAFTAFAVERWQLPAANLAVQKRT